MYKTKCSTFLLGMPLGFIFLLVSYLFLGLHMIDTTFYNTITLSNTLMWVRVVAQTIGFSLIATSYFVAGRYQGTSKRSYSIILLGTTSLILGVFGLLFILFSPLDLASVYSSIRVFTIVNLAVLSYIILFLCRKIGLANDRPKNLLSAPLAFFCLWIGQFSFLVWSMSNNNTYILMASQVARIAGFVLLIQIYYQARKEALTVACG